MGFLVTYDTIEAVPSTTTVDAGKVYLNEDEDYVFRSSSGERNGKIMAIIPRGRVRSIEATVNSEDASH